MRQWANLLGRHWIQAELAFHTCFSLQLDTSVEVWKELVAVWLQSHLVCLFERVRYSLMEGLWDTAGTRTPSVMAARFISAVPFLPWENNDRVCRDEWHRCGLRALSMSDKLIHKLIRATNCMWWCWLCPKYFIILSQFTLCKLP